MKYAFYPDGIMKYDIITLPARNYTGSAAAAELNILLNASVKQFYNNLPAAEKCVWMFAGSYELNSNTFDITSKLPASNVDARNSWSILTDATMKI